MSKFKLWAWIFCYIISFGGLIVLFPILLFAFYPYGVIAFIIYLIGVIFSSVLAFSQKSGLVAKKMLISILLAPVAVLLIFLVLIELGWFHYPG